jgi:hypothetical protein
MPGSSRFSTRTSTDELRPPDRGLEVLQSAVVVGSMCPHPSVNEVLFDSNGVEPLGRETPDFA